MKIPIDIDKEFAIGDRVKLLQDITRDFVLFKAGHEFTIIGVDDYGLVLQDEDGDVIKRMLHNHSERFTKIISYKHAENKYHNLKLDNEISLIISCNCPFKDMEYWDREAYEVCKKQKNTNCKGNIKCLDFGKDDIISRIREQDIPKLEKYIRLRKLENLM